ncbi:SDR family NAD(P)-dependent oxidoreductase [Algoriphagus litoralis]|uniref:SDR family NAD(P)-dependent oxidoreductase n=1 Tax=Algoriphagus litoralis TaxID=2202829 RepID=UPI000DB9BE7E|nr:SDR family NAD(P)-dependent oxidoreductase [Algoriphagus litoralis]
MVTKSFENSRVIITGAASGIGKELVRQLYPLTKRILAADNSAKSLERLQAEFPDLEGFLLSDLSKKEGNGLILDWVKNNWQGADFCFANAGKAEYQAADLQDWKQMDALFQLNVFSPIQLGMELRKSFPKTHIRHVITCSAIAFWAIPGYSIYGGTKAAVLQWARTIWAENTGDWLTLVFPIATSTAFFETAGQEIPKAFPIQQPQIVAKKMLSGVAAGKKKIFPSLLFRVMLHLNNFLYVIRPISQAIESKKFRSWIAKQKDSSQV